MGAQSRERGRRFEYRLVELGRKLGYPLEIYRRPLSGSSSLGKLDVVILLNSVEILLEAKYRKGGEGFKSLYTFSSFQEEGVIVNDRWLVLSFPAFLGFKVTGELPPNLLSVQTRGLHTVERWLKKALEQGGEALVVGMWRKEPLTILPIPVSEATNFGRSKGSRNPTESETVHRVDCSDLRPEVS